MPARLPGLRVRQDARAPRDVTKGRTSQWSRDRGESEIIATLLAGVVATNVAVLRLNMKLDRLGRERTDLRAQNAQLSSQLSSAASAPRIQGLAAKQLGWVQATSDQT